MKSKRGLLVFFLVSSLLVLVILSVAFIVNRMVRQKEITRMKYMPPTVLINEPSAGEQLPAGEYFYLNTTINTIENTSIEKVEIYMDGVLLEEKIASAEEPIPPILDEYLILPGEGTHVLAIRATNSLGMTGQSLAMMIMGVPKPLDTTLLVPLEGEETPADIAEQYGLDAGELLAANPDIITDQPAPGTVVMVPQHAEPAEQNPQMSLQLPSNTAPPQPFGPELLPLTPSFLSSLDLSFIADLPPAAPEISMAEVQNCKVNLGWKDNSSNEKGFNIWVKGENNYPPHIFITLQASPYSSTSYFFDAPAGGKLTFWVEAFNAVGAQSSNVVVLDVDPTCGSTPYSYLNIDILDIHVSGSYDKAYCYISLQGATETRFPQNDGDFIPIQGGTGNMGKDSSFYLPIPTSQEVVINGECWGWSGGTLNVLGVFGNSIPKQNWDGTKLILKSSLYDIGIRIYERDLQKETETIYGTYSLEDFALDPTIPKPYDVFYENNPNCNGVACPTGFLTWKWEPGQNNNTEIKGFLILQDMKILYLLPNPKARGGEIIRPEICGSKITFQVAAYTETSRSLASAPYLYILPQCKYFAMVKFETLDIPWTGDGFNGGPCDNLQLYYTIRLIGNAKTIQKSFGYGGENGQFNVGNIMDLQVIHCTKDWPPYTFYDLGKWWGDPNPDKLIVALDLDQKVNINVGTWFFDQDSDSGNDMFGVRNLSHKFASIDEAVTKLYCGKQFCDPMVGYAITDDADTRVCYTLTVYPNPCEQVPQGIPLPGTGP